MPAPHRHQGNGTLLPGAGTSVPGRTSDNCVEPVQTVAGRTHCLIEHNHERNIQKLVKLKRYGSNPILSADSARDWEANHVSNSAAVVKDGKVHLFYRAEGRDTRNSSQAWFVSRIGHAVSSDGFTIDCRYPEPALDILGEELPFTDGVEDPRIVEIDGVYHMVYCTTSVYPERLAWATSKDLITFDKHGILMPDYSQRTAGLLPERIDGEYVLFHRILPHLWISRSRDMKEWHSSQVLVHSRQGHWTESKMGIGATPIKTEQA
ncbi:MAG TPA: hypothetical protein DCL60_13565 [Armatimonadetes bacterium]|nr:hypothetical protein [Armatimonadota bacterium]